MPTPIRAYLATMIRFAPGRLFAAVATARWPYLSLLRRSDLLQVLTSDVARVGAGTQLAMDLVASGVLSAAYVAAAISLAPADRFVRALPDGLATEIGDRGVRLSGGERQRIAIARALVRQPSLLVLDEATSGLDPDTEREIHQALDRSRGDRTLVVITHRRAVLAEADQVVLLDNGRGAAVGTWEEGTGATTRTMAPASR